MSASDKAREDMRAELAALKAMRLHKRERLDRLRKHTPIKGSEHIAARAARRYTSEIEDLTRQIGLLEANLEGLE